MSALVKPLVNSTKVIGGASDAVNVEFASAITKTDKPLVPNVNQPAQWNIIFNVSDNGVGTPNFIIWKYDNVTDRDADFASILALASTTLV